MFGTILQRVIASELFKTFFIALISLTGLFLLGGIVAEASQRGLAPAQIFKIIPLMIPSMLPYTIPTTTLFATCNVYGRMAKDNEIIALRAAGVNLWEILKPAILLGVFGTLATATLEYQVIPHSFRAVREQIIGDVNEFLITVLKRQGSFRHGKLPYVLFAREVHGDRLIDVIVKHRAAPNSSVYDTVVRAREAHIRIEEHTDANTHRTGSYVVIDMTQCVVCNNDATGVNPNVMNVQNHRFIEPLPPELLGDKDSLRSCDLTWPELFERATVLEARNENTRAKIGLTEREVEATHNPALNDHLKHYRNVYRGQAREVRCFEAEKHLRPALALGCMCFVLTGVPIGIWANRADFLSSFIIGFLPIIITYYPILICGTNFAKDGRLPIPLAMWSANAIFAVIAVGMCWRLTRR